MKLEKFDEKCIRLLDERGEIFEGYCTYNNREYNLHEYGRDEESLDILNFKFYKSDIKDVLNLENYNGKYGHFSSAYGHLEEEIVKEGIDFIEDTLFSEWDEHVYRLLVYLEKFIDTSYGYEFPIRNEVISLMREVLKYNENEKIINKIKEMIGE